MKLYADEDFDHGVVTRLRMLGHDVVTVMDVNRRGLRDVEQLVYATEAGRALITFNRADFHALHRQHRQHAGIITCTRDPDVEALATRIHAESSARSTLTGELIRIERGSARPQRQSELPRIVEAARTNEPAHRRDDGARDREEQATLGRDDADDRDERAGRRDNAARDHDVSDARAKAPSVSPKSLGDTRARHVDAQQRGNRARRASKVASSDTSPSQLW